MTEDGALTVMELKKSVVVSPKFLPDMTLDRRRICTFGSGIVKTPSMHVVYDMGNEYRAIGFLCISAFFPNVFAVLVQPSHFL